MATSKTKVLKKDRKGKPTVYTKTQNVVVSASIHRELPLERLAAKLERADYNPETFPGLILKIDVPKASALLFSSGKIICTGTKSLSEARTAIAAIVEKLDAIGLKVKGDTEIAVQNMVASGDVGGRLNLNEIMIKFDNTEYDPEQFPGLVYKLPNSHITFLLFGTGKIVITGARSEKEIVDSVYVLRDQLIKASLLKD